MTIGLGILIVYTIALLIMAWYTGKDTEKTIKDYTTASSTLGIFVLTLTFSATYHSAYAFMGAYGFCYNHGVGFWVNGIWTVYPGILLWYLGRRFWFMGKKYGYITLSEFLEDTYGSKYLALLVTAISVIFTLPYITMQAIGVAYIFQTISGNLVSFEVGTVLFLILMVLLVWLGGMKGVAWTDAAQGVFMFVGMVIGAYIVVKANFPTFAEGFKEALKINPDLFSLPGAKGTMTNLDWIGRWTTITLGMMMYPHIILRFYAGKSLRILKWSAVSSAAYLTFIYIFTPAVGIIGNVIYPGFKNPDLIFPTMLMDYTPVVFASIIIAGALAASMSTGDSQLHALSSIITIDVYRKYSPKATEIKQYYFAKSLIIIIGLISVIFALTQPGMLVDIITASTGGVVVIAPAVIGALYWKGSTPLGAWASIVSGEVVLICCYLIEGALFGIIPGLWAFIVAIVSFVVVSMFTKARPRTHEIINDLNGFFCGDEEQVSETKNLGLTN